MELRGYLNDLKDISEDQEYIWLMSDNVNCLNTLTYNMPSIRSTLYLNEKKEFCGVRVKRTDISYKHSYIEIVGEDGEKIDLGTLLSDF